jgi:hypothetical protein
MRTKEILYEVQDSQAGDQRRMNKTYRAIMAYYTWPNMRRGVEYVKRCNSCQINKILTPKHKASMEITTTAEHRFEKYLDVVGPSPVTQENNRYI